MGTTLSKEILKTMVANCYLEGTYSEVYPDISQDAEGMKKLLW